MYKKQYACAFFELENGVIIDTGAGYRVYKNDGKTEFFFDFENCILFLGG